MEIQKSGIILSGCYKKPSKWRHSNRTEKLHRSIKKIIKKFWKWKKLEQLFEKFWKILRSKIFENFRSQKFSKSCSNFFHFQKKLMIFFMDRGSFSVRRRWDRLEVSVLQLEARPKKPTLFVRFVTNTYLWKSAYSELTIYY